MEVLLDKKLNIMDKSPSSNLLFPALLTWSVYLPISSISFDSFNRASARMQLDRHGNIHTGQNNDGGDDDGDDDDQDPVQATRCMVVEPTLSMYMYGHCLYVCNCKH